MKLSLSLLVATVPTLLILIYLYYLDRDVLRSKRAWFTLGISALSTVLVMVIVLPLAFFMIHYDISEPLLYGVLCALPGSAIPEESVKMLLLAKVALRRYPFKKLKAGIIYGALTALGYATVENIWDALDEGILTALGGIMAVPMHAMLGAIMGYYLMKGRLSEESKYKYIMLAWVLPVALHSLYNFPGYLIEGILQSGSNLWVPMYIFLKVVSLYVFFKAFLIAKKCLYFAKEEEGTQLNKGVDQDFVNPLHKNDKFM